MAEYLRRVVWAEAAVRDLEEIIAFVAADSTSNARRLLDRMHAKAESLERSPLRGRIVPELLGFGMRTWRALVVRPYRLIYRVEARDVMVLAVFDSRRDLEDILFERLVRVP